MLLIKNYKILRKIYTVRPLHAIVTSKFGEKLLVYFKRKQNEILFEDSNNVKEITERDGRTSVFTRLSSYYLKKINSKKQNNDSQLIRKYG